MSISAGTFDASSYTIAFGVRHPAGRRGQLNRRVHHQIYERQRCTVTGTGYYNLTINGTGTFSLGGAATVGGALTVTSGTFDANGKTVSVTGLTTVNAGTDQASTATQTLTGGLTVSSGGFVCASRDGNAGNLTVSGGTFTGSSGTVSATAVALSSGSLTAPVLRGRSM